MDIAKLQLTTFSTKYHSLYAISPNRPYVVVPKKFKSKFHSPFFFQKKISYNLMIHLELLNT